MQICLGDSDGQRNGMLKFIGSQRFGNDLTTEQQQHASIGSVVMALSSHFLYLSFLSSALFFPSQSE